MVRNEKRVEEAAGAQKERVDRGREAGRRKRNKGDRDDQVEECLSATETKEREWRWLASRRLMMEGSAGFNG